MKPHSDKLKTAFPTIKAKPQKQLIMSEKSSTKVQSLPLLNAGLNVGQLEKLEMEREAAKHGLGVITAAIFLAGEMAGSGVLALPFAMVGTGKTSKKFSND